MNSARHPALCLAQADYDGQVLTVHLPDGSAVSGPDPLLGDPIDLDWEAGDHVSGHLVEGPWAAALEPLAGEPVYLARMQVGRGGWSGSAVSLIGDASISELGHGPLDARRFRMLIQIEGGDPFEEDTWIGSEITIGSTILAVRSSCPRCVVTTRNPDTGLRDIDAIRAMISARGVGDLGVYCDVVQAGTISVGDEIGLVAR